MNIALGAGTLMIKYVNAPTLERLGGSDSCSNNSEHFFRI